MFVFVTGASSGVGEAFGCRPAADGWDLAIMARRGERLSALAGRLTGKYGTSVQTCVGDCSRSRRHTTGLTGKNIEPARGGRSRGDTR